MTEPSFDLESALDTPTLRLAKYQAATQVWLPSAQGSVVLRWAIDHTLPGWALVTPEGALAGLVWQHPPVFETHAGPPYWYCVNLLTEDVLEVEYPLLEQAAGVLERQVACLILPHCSFALRWRTGRLDPKLKEPPRYVR